MLKIFKSNIYPLFSTNNFSIFKTFLPDINFLRIQKFFFGKHHQFQTYRNLGHPVKKRVQTKHIYNKSAPKIEEETPSHEGREDLIIEIPVRRENPYLK